MKLKKIREKKHIAEASIYSHQGAYKFQVQELYKNMKLQEENSRRRNELAIYHFVVDAELRKVLYRPVPGR